MTPTAAKTAQAIRAITPGMWWMVVSDAATSTHKAWPIPAGN